MYLPAILLILIACYHGSALSDTSGAALDAQHSSAPLDFSIVRRNDAWKQSLQRRGQKEKDRKARREQAKSDARREIEQRQIAEGLLVDINGELIPTDKRLVIAFAPSWLENPIRALTYLFATSRFQYLHRLRADPDHGAKINDEDQRLKLNRWFAIRERVSPREDDQILALGPMEIHMTNEHDPHSAVVTWRSFVFRFDARPTGWAPPSTITEEKRRRSTWMGRTDPYDEEEWAHRCKSKHATQIPAGNSAVADSEAL